MLVVLRATEACPQSLLGRVRGSHQHEGDQQQ